MPLPSTLLTALSSAAMAASVQVLSLHSQGSPLMIIRHVSRGFRSLLLPAGTQGVHLNMLVHSPGSHGDVNANENANLSEFMRPTQTQGK